MTDVVRMIRNYEGKKANALNWKINTIFPIEFNYRQE